MHEVSICRSLLDLVEEAIAGQDVNSVSIIWLEIGRFSHLDEAALRFCFASVANNTVAGDAQLQITRCDGQGLCAQCGFQQTLEQRFEACQQCGNFPVALVSGDQMRLKSLEVC